MAIRTSPWRGTGLQRSMLTDHGVREYVIRASTSPSPHSRTTGRTSPRSRRGRGCIRVGTHGLAFLLEITRTIDPGGLVSGTYYVGDYSGHGHHGTEEEILASAADDELDNHVDTGPGSNDSENALTDSEASTATALLQRDKPCIKQGNLRGSNAHGHVKECVISAVSQSEFGVPDGKMEDGAIESISSSPSTAIGSITFAETTSGSGKNKGENGGKQRSKKSKSRVRERALRQREAAKQSGVLGKVRKFIKGLSNCALFALFASVTALVFVVVALVYQWMCAEDEASLSEIDENQPLKGKRIIKTKVSGGKRVSGKKISDKQEQDTASERFETAKGELGKKNEVQKKVSKNRLSTMKKQEDDVEQPKKKNSSSARGSPDKDAEQPKRGSGAGVEKPRKKKSAGDPKASPRGTGAPATKGPSKKTSAKDEKAPLLVVPPGVASVSLLDGTAPSLRVQSVEPKLTMGAALRAAQETLEKIEK
ncbi:unnamed protein product [Amoebophrya sp. A25]|nr:unnamed protein product [Amoebophrya sp. A25]|eukprot:GSA25T00001966001.1